MESGADLQLPQIPSEDGDLISIRGERELIKLPGVNAKASWIVTVPFLIPDVNVTIQMIYM